MKDNLFRQTPPRLLLFFPTLFIKLVAAGISGVAFVLKSGPLFVLGMALWIIWFFLLFFIAMPQTDNWLNKSQRWLKPLAICTISILLVGGILETTAVICLSADIPVVNFIGSNTHQILGEQLHNLSYNDATALCHQAIDNLRAGKNPYAEANIVLATQRFGNPSDKVTPIQVGCFAADFPYPSNAKLMAVWDEAMQNPQNVPPEIESRLNYPAACFIIPAPFIWLGITDLRWVYVIFILMTFAFVLIKAPRDTRFWLASAFIISIDLWQAIASGETGSLYLPFLLLAWLLWNRKWWLAAICMGIAISIKQVPWFFTLFYMLLLIRSMGWRHAFAVASIICGIFLAFNLPFIISNPSIWLDSILAPLREHFFPLGVGPVGLVIVGWWKVDSSLVFTVMELLVLLSGLVWYWYKCRRYPYSGLILSVLPLFFAWRSSWWYFFYFDIILITVIVLNEYAGSSRNKVDNKQAEI
jgi:hypothetical protein